MLIVGGGYLGLELAAAAVEAGCSVSLIEAAPRILQRVAAEPTSDCFRAMHRSHGVDIIEGAGLVSLHGNHTVRSARLSNGRDIQTDCVFIGIGISPNTSLAERAGLKVENGICVDEFCRTSDPNIWAAGDCAAFPCGEKFYRLESVGNATAMGECVAGNLLGLNRPYTAKPWFWSDQYDQRLQIAGVSAGHDRVVVRAGKKHASVSHWYYNGARLIAADVINDPKTYVIAKRLIENGLSPAPGLIADPDYNIKLALKG